MVLLTNCLMNPCFSIFVFWTDRKMFPHFPLGTNNIPIDYSSPPATSCLA